MTCFSEGIKDFETNFVHSITNGLTQRETKLSKSAIFDFNFKFNTCINWFILDHLKNSPTVSPNNTLTLHYLSNSNMQEGQEYRQKKSSVGFNI